MTMTYSKAMKDEVLAVLRKQLESGGNAAPGEVKELFFKFNIPSVTLYGWKSDLKRRLNVSKPGMDKFQIIIETSSMNELELGEYLRKNGILREELDSWIKSARESVEETKASSAALLASQRENKELQRELRRKEKALAEAAALLVLSKKARAIWGEPGDD